MSTRTDRRQNIRFRIRKKISGTAQNPRLAVYRSNSEIYMQLIDDTTGTTLASASSRDKDTVAQPGNKTEKSKMVGVALANKAKALGLANCVFDRSGYLYHGRVKAAADGAREGGMQF